MGGNNGYVAPERILSEARADVETSLGKFQIRRLGMKELCALLGGLLDVSALSGLTDEALSNPDRRAAMMKDQRLAETLARMEKVVAAGVVQPRLGLDPFDVSTGGAVVSDLPVSDTMALFTRICELSNYSKAEGERIRPS